MGKDGWASNAANEIRTGKRYCVKIETSFGISECKSKKNKKTIQETL